MKTNTEKLQDYLRQEVDNKGLLDVKFCVLENANVGSSVEQASKQVLSAVDAYEQGKTREYSDF